MVPTNDTASAESTATRSSVPRRSRFTSMPKLAARSSPRRSAVRAHAFFIESGKAIASAAASTPIFGQSARASEPSVQNTRPWSASADAMNCISSTSA